MIDEKEMDDVVKSFDELINITPEDVKSMLECIADFNVSRGTKFMVATEVVDDYLRYNTDFEDILDKARAIDQAFAKFEQGL